MGVRYVHGGPHRIPGWNYHGKAQANDRNAPSYVPHNLTLALLQRPIENRCKEEWSKARSEALGAEEGTLDCALLVVLHIVGLDGADGRGGEVAPRGDEGGIDQHSNLAPRRRDDGKCKDMNSQHAEAKEQQPEGRIDEERSAV